MAYFHYRCGERITLLNENCTAIRNDADFDHGIVVTAEPLQNDVLFEVKIDRLISSWSGSLEIGITDISPLNLEFPACASKLQQGSWVMTSFSVTKNGATLIHQYGVDLDGLGQDDRVGVLRTFDGQLYFYVNGESQGLAADNIPNQVYGIVDLYGQCVQVSITSPLLREHNNDDCLSGSSVLAIDNDNLNVTLGGDLSELSLSSSNSFDIRMDVVNVSQLTLPTEEKLRFHDRCGSLIKLSNGHRTGERRRPLDEFNNGVVMTHRSLFDGELFEIRIDRLVDKWSGSIEMGITTHNPTTLVFPATMTNMRSGTIMMSGCGILTNGKGTRREYGDFNLDELSEGDRVGMMRKASGDVHYFINGLDQGVAAQRVSHNVWGVIDLYGMTIKVSIVERDEREEQNLMTRRTLRDQLQPSMVPGAPFDTSIDGRDYHDRLTFDENCGKHAEVINNGRTAHRPTAADDFNNAVVLTSRPLRPGELFQIRLDRVVTKWAGSIEIGVTTHNPATLEFPFTMTNVRSGTWMMTGSGIMHNGTTVLEQYGVNLDRLAVGDRVGCVRHDSGMLHFYVNGVDQGCAANHVPHRVYGVIDLYGQAVEATLLDGYEGDTGTLNANIVGTSTMAPIGGLIGSLTCAGEGNNGLGLGMTIMTGVLEGIIGEQRMIGGAAAGASDSASPRSDFRFHYIHGSNARIINNGLTAWRPRPLAEFNDGIVFSNRPLRPGELFEITLDNIVDRWSGSVELGVTAVKPEEINLPSTATDLINDTWMLSGSSVMENSVTILSKYPCDLDTLQAGTRIGVIVNANRSLEFYQDGRSQGVACIAITPTTPVYAVVDLYGSCAQVSIANSGRPLATPLGRPLGAGPSQAAHIAMETSGGADTPYPRSDDGSIVHVPITSVGVAATADVATAIGTSGTNGTAAVLKGILKTDDMLHRFSDLYNNNNNANTGNKFVSLQDGGRMAVRTASLSHSTIQQAPPVCQQLHQYIVYSATCLRPDELFEIVIMRMERFLAGGLIIGVTPNLPQNVNATVVPSTGDVAVVNASSEVNGDCDLDSGGALPTGAYYITGNEMRYGNQVYSKFAPSLHWLREGDRVGVLRSSVSSTCWKLMVNGEPVHHVNGPQTATNNASSKNSSMYVFVGLHGACAGVAIISRMLYQPPPPAQLTVAPTDGAGKQQEFVPAHVNMATVSGKMQDSLDHFPLADQDQQEPVSLEAPIASEELVSIDNAESVQNAVRYEFHENHGRNVEVTRDRGAATRVASYNQGVLLVQPALNVNQFVQIVIEKMDNRWQSSIIVGVVCCATVAERLNLPITALGFRGTCCIISNDWLCLNGIKTQSCYGERLDRVSVGSRVGVMVREDGLQMYIDGTAGETLPWQAAQQQQAGQQQLYAVFDLYGQCTQVKLINDSDYDEPLSSCENSSSCNPDFEKADLDCNEKEPKTSTHYPNDANNHRETSCSSSTLISEPNNSIVQTNQQYENNIVDNESINATNASLIGNCVTQGTVNNSSIGGNNCLSLPLLQQQQSPIVTTLVNTSTSSCIGTTVLQPPRLITPLMTIPSLVNANRRNTELHCLYQMKVIRFKRTLFLPEEFFTNEEPSCYCMNCYKFKSQDPDALKDESLIGWVTFPLKNLRNIQTDKWHTAYYGARLAALRKILDRAQLLTKSQLSTCHLIGYNNSDRIPTLNTQDDDSAQVISFSPSLQHCGTTESDLQSLNTNKKRLLLTKASSSSARTENVQATSIVLTQHVLAPTNRSADEVNGASANTTNLSCREGFSIRTAFQLLVKPGAYSVSAVDYAQWCTKETGAICLQALLIQLWRVNLPSMVNRDGANFGTADDGNV